MPEAVRRTVGHALWWAQLGEKHPDAKPKKGFGGAGVLEVVHKVIEGRGLTQAQAADILGIDQPKVSALIRGKLGGFSLDRLFRFLNALGQDVQIVIRPVRGRAREAVTRVASV